MSRHHFYSITNTINSIDHDLNSRVSTSSSTEFDNFRTPTVSDVIYSVFRKRCLYKFKLADYSVAAAFQLFQYVDILWAHTRAPCTQPNYRGRRRCGAGEQTIASDKRYNGECAAIVHTTTARYRSAHSPIYILFIIARIQWVHILRCSAGRSSCNCCVCTSITMTKRCLFIFPICTSRTIVVNINVIVCDAFCGNFSIYCNLCGQSQALDWHCSVYYASATFQSVCASYNAWFYSLLPVFQPEFSISTPLKPTKYLILYLSIGLYWLLILSCRK